MDIAMDEFGADGKVEAVAGQEQDYKGKKIEWVEWLQVPFPIGSRSLGGK